VTVRLTRKLNLGNGVGGYEFDVDDVVSPADGSLYRSGVEIYESLLADQTEAPADEVPNSDEADEA
jgi:hypothetical protein